MKGTLSIKVFKTSPANLFETDHGDPSKFHALKTPILLSLGLNEEFVHTYSFWPGKKTPGTELLALVNISTSSL